MKRNRGRNRRSGGQNPNRHYESTGPDVKIRGSAQQIYEKYQQYARDAQSAGDRVAAESYLQHAEHYFRIMAATMPRPPVIDNDQDTDDDMDVDGDTDDGGDEPSASDSSASQQRKDSRNNNRRGRSRDRNDRGDDKAAPADALEVVDEGGEEPLEMGKGNEDAVDGADEDGEAKPRRTRSRASYRKRESREDSGDGDSAGVMAIVSRGSSRRSKDTSADTGEPVSD